ncbi:4a-hydroxytetrahydrobiopterin dehydratase [Dactylosporangium salmoneum]|uniref:Putative pterin-4-alpha-carbinolamine dehydratase n=1 Tax=Dactylosporangium salmoneum TaxID=53361 RepID=A0ABN3H359_9ACTN
MVDVLGNDEVSAALAGLAGWSGDAQGIERSVTAPTFLDGIRLVAEVAHVAEQADHHPDIDIRWRTVTFRLSTHSAGGVTEKDIVLAGQINELIG